MMHYPLTTKEYVPQAVILADGDYPMHEIPLTILSRCPVVICCDGAASDFINRGGSPAAIVGDGDSIPAALREEYGEIYHFSADQESNDLTKAVEFAARHGYTEIAIVGATGKREDHTLGNISLLADYSKTSQTKMITDYGVFETFDGYAEFESFTGQQMSVITLDRAARITTHNLLYPLSEALLPLWWQGTLNQSLGARFGLHSTGTALVFRVFPK